ncbi:MAG TPA: S41 family peptidase [Wenzhouxiangellaceae bacterium]|nr:S41 family peptidase [Wenzhouxiangellaceae bacterium]
MDMLQGLRRHLRLARLARRAVGSLVRGLVWPAWLMMAFSPTLDAPLSREVAAASFDEVWQQVRDSHYDYERVRDDWERLHATLRDKAANARDREALRLVLAELLSALDDSHYSILPEDIMEQGQAPANGSETDSPGAGDPGTAGIRIALVGGQVLVTRVEPESPGARAGLNPGMAVVSVNDWALVESLESLARLDGERDRRWARTFLQSAVQDRIGWPDLGRTLRLGLADIDGRVVHVEIAPEATPVQTFRAGTLPPMRFEFDAERVARNSGACIGRIEFTSWVPALGAALQRALPLLLDCRGLVIDLRGNPGGVMAMMMPVAGWLFDEVTTLGTMRNASGEIHFRALPRRVLSDGTAVAPFAGPVAILVDAASASTSEMFAAGLQGSGRAQVFGTRTPGMALPANARRLSSGDSLMYVVADYIGPTGARIEGGGVEPDQVIVPTPETLTGCIDPVLLAAFDWIEQRPAGFSCSTTKER